MPRPNRPSTETIQTWQNRRFGMFIHWGLYSLLGGIYQGRQIHGYNEQIQAHARIPKGEYAALAEQFNPIEWDPEAIADLALAAEMKFIVLTSKHHDGFSLFHTKQSDFNVVDATPYGQDIVLGLAKACRERGLGFGVYFSTIDWHFEGANGIDFDPVEGIRNDNQIPDAHAQFNRRQLEELMTSYGPISEVWFDMGCPTPEQSILFTDTVHQAQSETLVSGRVFNYQGDFVVMGDNEIPPFAIDEPWQSPASIYHETWGYRSWQDRSDFETKLREHQANLIRVVSRGGNYLLNIGPKGDGSIVEFEADLLRAMGTWIKTHLKAIEGSSRQPFRTLEFGAATLKGTSLFLFILDRPADGILKLPGLRTDIAEAKWIGDSTHLAPVEIQSDLRSLNITDAHLDGQIAVIEVLFKENPEITESGITPDSSGCLELTIENADRHYHRNGQGYYDPAKLYRLRWWVEKVDTSSPMQLRLDGIGTDFTTPFTLQIAGATVRIAENSPQITASDFPLEWTTMFPSVDSFEVEIRVPVTEEKGTALPIHFLRLTLSPQGMP